MQWNIFILITLLLIIEKCDVIEDVMISPETWNVNYGSFSSSVKITNVICFDWNRTSNIDIENEVFEVADSTLEENIFSFVKKWN